MLIILVVIAGLQSCDSGDVQNPEGGQLSQASYGRDRGRSLKARVSLLLQERTYNPGRQYHSEFCLKEPLIL